MKMAVLGDFRIAVSWDGRVAIRTGLLPADESGKEEDEAKAQDHHRNADLHRLQQCQAGSPAVFDGVQKAAVLHPAAVHVSWARGHPQIQLGLVGPVPVGAQCATGHAPRDGVPVLHPGDVNGHGVEVKHVTDQRHRAPRVLRLDGDDAYGGWTGPLHRVLPESLSIEFAGLHLGIHPEAGVGVRV